MGTARLGAVRRVFDGVRQLAADDRGDGELLDRFRHTRDDAAFGVLVRRHGPMVLGVCRRVLRDGHAADDAFQATFLVLARRADAVRPPGVLGAWLYGVAYRTALKARGREFRRRQVEQEYANRPGHATECRPDSVPDADLRRVIDQQLNDLPEKYRLPLVLCAVQGLGKSEAAERLGLPEGTVSSRLARGREMLRDRLSRRGVVVPAAGVAAVLVPNTLRAAVPPELSKLATATATGASPVAPAVLTLSREVLTAMTLTKWNLLGTLAVAVALAGSGAGLYVAQADEKKPGAEKPAAGMLDAAKPAKPGDKPREGDKPRDGEKPRDGDKPGTNKPRDGDNPAAKPSPGKKRRAYTGQIGSVDVAARSLTLIRAGEAGPREDVVKLTADAKILIDGKEAKLEDLRKGATAECVIAAARDGQPLESSEVVVSEAKLSGVVVKESNATTVTLLGGPKNSALPDRVLKLAPGGKVMIDGKESKLTDLQAGDRASVVLTADKSAATLITVNTGGGDGGNPKPNKGEGDNPKPKGEGDKPK